MDSSSYQQNNLSEDNNDPSRNNNNNDDDDESSKKLNDGSNSKKGKGRKKIPMEKIKSDTNRQVTFSKRRVGVFKKASELHTLCGADNAIVVFSPSGKAHSFAAPNMQTITDQFLGTQTAHLGSSSRFNNNLQQQMHVDNPIIRQRNAELADLERQLADEKRKKKEHARTRKVKMNQIDYPPNIDLLDLNQLQALKDSLLGLKNALNCGGVGVGPVAAPMGPNIQIQGPPPPPPSSHNNNIDHQFYYGNNVAMRNDDIGPFLPPDHDLLMNNNYDQTMFVEFGVNNNNVNNNNANIGAAPFLPPSMVTSNQYGYFDQTTNNQYGYFDQTMNNQYGYFDQTTNNNNNNNNSAAYHQFPPHPNDHEAGGSSSLVFLNNEEEEVLPTNQDGGEGAEDAGEARLAGGGPNIDGYGSGFNNNYNNFGF